MEPALNGDMKQRAVAHTAEMAWTESPSGSVWRKRVHRVGPPESGQVTSVVRYSPGASFPAHDHPDGEEILVLDGIFSDEHGDWPAGTYLLNPEGFRHAPFSKDGCLILVKLRQYAGEGREHVVVETKAAAWEPTAMEGIELLTLYDRPEFADAMQLQRWAPGAHHGVVTYRGGCEIFVLGGSFEDEQGVYREGSWLRLPEGGRHAPRSDDGCTLYVKTGGIAALHSDATHA